MSYLIRFEIIKKLINKTFPNIKPKYIFKHFTKHYDVRFKHINGYYTIAIDKDSTWVEIKKILKE